MYKLLKKIEQGVTVINIRSFVFGSVAMILPFFKIGAQATVPVAVFQNRPAAIANSEARNRFRDSLVNHRAIVNLEKQIKRSQKETKKQSQIACQTPSVLYQSNCQHTSSLVKQVRFESGLRTLERFLEWKTGRLHYWAPTPEANTLEYLVSEPTPEEINDAFVKKVFEGEGIFLKLSPPEVSIFAELFLVKKSNVEFSARSSYHITPKRMSELSFHVTFFTENFQKEFCDRKAQNNNTKTQLFTVRSIPIKFQLSPTSKQYVKVGSQFEFQYQYFGGGLI